MQGSEEGFPDLRTRDALHSYLRGVAETLGVEEDDDAVAAELDLRDSLSHMRSSFHIPRSGALGEMDRSMHFDFPKCTVYAIILCFRCGSL